MEFTTDWFSMKIPYWKEIFAKYKKTPWNCLEIGSWEGRSACFLLGELPDSKLTCIDTFQGSVEHVNEDTTQIYSRFLKNTDQYKDRLNVYTSKSFDVLKKIDDTFDFIFVDGSHEYKDVVFDGLLAWKLLKPGGLMIFDDYNVFEGVNKACFIFQNVVEDEIAEIFGAYDQMIYVKKTADPCVPDT